MSDEGKRNVLGYWTGRNSLPADGFADIQPPLTIAFGHEHLKANPCWNELQLPETLDEGIMDAILVCMADPRESSAL